MTAPTVGQAGTMAAAPPRRRHVPVGHYRGLGAWTVLFFLFLYMPIVVLVVYSFNESRLALIWTGFSLDWYAKVLANDSIRRAALNSLIIASIATVVATAVATVSALSLARGGHFKRPVVGGDPTGRPSAAPKASDAVDRLMD